MKVLIIKKLRKFRMNVPLHLMLLPALIITFVFCYIPLFGLRIAFQDFNVSVGYFGEQVWVGFQNFQYMLSLPDFWEVTFNTLYIATSKLILGQLASIFVAILLNEINHYRFKRIAQTAIYLPHFVSWVILAGLFVDLLSPSSGAVNDIIKFFGGQPVYFLGDKFWFPITMIITDIWKSFGFGTILYLAAISNIPQELYEFATVDGANKLQKIWYITLPGMKMIIALVALLNLGSILNAGFDQIFNMYSPQVYQVGDILDTLIFRIGIMDMQFGISTALGLMKSLVSAILISVAYFTCYKVADYRIF